MIRALEGMMKKSFVALAAIIVTQAATVRADTFTYQCKLKGKLYPLKVDGSHHELIWRGKSFKTTELQAGEQDDCPRFGWRAERGGQKFDFCTATGNSANFSDNGSDVECEQD